MPKSDNKTSLIFVVNGFEIVSTTSTLTSRCTPR